MSNPKYYQYHPDPNVMPSPIFHIRESSEELVTLAAAKHVETNNTLASRTEKTERCFFGVKLWAALVMGFILVSMRFHITFRKRSETHGKETTFTPTQRYDDVILREWLKEHPGSQIRGKDESSTVRHSFSLHEIALGGPSAEKSSSLKSSSLSSSNIYFNDTKAYSMFFESSGYNLDFFSVAPGWDAQINQRYCGVAGSTAILNSLRTLRHGEGVDLPLDRYYNPYHYATQTDVFNKCTNENVIHYEKSEDGSVEYDGTAYWPVGTSLQQVGEILRCHLDNKEWKVNVVEVDPEKVSLDEMRQTIIDTLLNEKSRALVNYDRAHLYQAGNGGHFSPVGAYHPPTDSFLVMDVAKYKYPPVWTKAELLYSAMASDDFCGMWNWPGAQKNLGEYGDMSKAFELTDEDFKKIVEILGCQFTYRGFIVVEQID